MKNSMNFPMQGNTYPCSYLKERNIKGREVTKEMRRKGKTWISSENIVAQSVLKVQFGLYATDRNGLES